MWLCADRQVLALKSEVFCGICESAPSGTGPENKLHIPLPDCSSKEARIFLDFIYNNTPVSDPLAAESLTKVRSSQAILHSSTALVCLILTATGMSKEFSGSALATDRTWPGRLHISSTLSRRCSTATTSWRRRLMMTRASSSSPR